MKIGCWVVLLGSLGFANEGLVQAGERIVMCQRRAGACDGATVLGDTAGVKWARVADAALLAGTSMPQVLYFSQREYDEAMAGLSGKDREEAILHRREVVSKNLSGFVYQELTSDLLQAAFDAKGGDLEILVEAAAILGSSEERLFGRTAGQLLDLARHDLAELQVELPKGPLVKVFAQEADAAGALAAEISNDPKQALHPFAEAMRAYFVPSLSKQYQDVLKLELAVSPRPWHGGVVTLVAEHQLSQPPFKGQALRLLYENEGEYRADVMELTGAQLDRRFAARLRQRNDRSSFVARCAFHHAVDFHAITARLIATGPPWIDKWLKIAAADLDNLRQVLAAMAPRGDAKRNQERPDLRTDFTLGTAMLEGSPMRARHTGKMASAVQALSRLSRGWSGEGAR
jgi:hypothetical protein